MQFVRQGEADNVIFGLNMESGSLFQLESLMQHPYCEFHVFLVHHHGNFYFGGGNHLDVDAFLGQGAEHFAGDADVRTHATPTTDTLAILSPPTTSRAPMCGCT